jgi:hypothetical protein
MWCGLIVLFNAARMTEIKYDNPGAAAILALRALGASALGVWALVLLIMGER